MSLRIINVRLFDGDGLSERSTLTASDGLITSISSGDVPGEMCTTSVETLDADGATLLPGLVDAHLHLSDRHDLDLLAANGITTAFDMASWPPEFTNSLRNQSETTAILSAGVPFIGPDGPHSHFVTSDHAVVTDPKQVPSEVNRRIADGSDFIKIVLEGPGRGGPSPQVARAVVEAAHRGGVRVVAHAASIESFRLAVECGADIVTHVPMDAPVDADLARRLAQDGRITIPTLCVSETLTSAVDRPGTDYVNSRDSVVALRAAGVPVLAGTDSVESPGAPFSIPLGTSLHRELELLVDAGWSPSEALGAATWLPAHHFHLDDRGALTPGRRADLVLVEGDPTADIGAVRDIVDVWVGGERIVR
ncbi:amidohydrolase family protein [Rhodococcus sp. NPDC058521]|uniref:amidohydrolase family protein n=1 Tax=Rhodococcus sp. NPDC058521 TaxID=3346536 RepID=UPI00364F148A